MTDAERPSLTPRARTLTAELKEQIVGILEAHRDASAMLFGSFARNDQDSDSDVDFLLVKKDGGPSFRRDRIDASVYAAEKLHRMAQTGSLFVLHLRLEGVLMRDDGGTLERCLAAYVAPTTYEPLYAELRAAGRLLDVPERVYRDNWKGFHRVGLFLLRTALFGHMAEKGTPTFSMQEISRLLGNPQIAEVWGLKRCAYPDWTRFVLLREVLASELSSDLHNPLPSWRRLLIASREQSPLTVSLGRRLLGSGLGVASYS